MSDSGGARFNTLDWVIGGILIAVTLGAIGEHFHAVTTAVAWLGLMALVLMLRMAEGIANPMLWLYGVGPIVVLWALVVLWQERSLQAARHAEILAQLREIQDALAPLAAREREKEMMRDVRASLSRHEEAVRRHGHEQALRRPVEGGLDADGGPHGQTR
jgi:hypothetical protein